NIFATVSAAAQSIMSPTTAARMENESSAQVQKNISFKNIADGDVAISITQHIGCAITVCDVEGRNVLSNSGSDARSYILSRRALKPGIYIVSARLTGDKTVHARVFMK
ncbi:MAG: hypothetical protein PHC61_08410, partial [Chitinivibrionales bacterium]|nr:hypothetical protein [Chitinivibrionales bacterium]